MIHLAPVKPGTGRWVRVACPDCHGLGYLWMGGKDTLDCPTCAMRGTVRFYEQETMPPPTRVFVGQVARALTPPAAGILTVERKG